MELSTDSVAVSWWWAFNLTFYRDNFIYKEYSGRGYRFVISLYFLSLFAINSEWKYCLALFDFNWISGFPVFSPHNWILCRRVWHSFSRLLLLLLPFVGLLLLGKESWILEMVVCLNLSLISKAHIFGVLIRCVCRFVLMTGGSVAQVSQQPFSLRHNAKITLKIKFCLPKVKNRMNERTKMREQTSKQIRVGADKLRSSKDDAYEFERMGIRKSKLGWKL